MDELVPKMTSTIPAGKKSPALKTIPSDLIFEILTWLPGKPVARFKCVCKGWLAMIRSGPFRKAYRSRNRGLIMYWCEDTCRQKNFKPRPDGSLHFRYYDWYGKFVPEEYQGLDPDRRLLFYYSSVRRLNEPPPAGFSPLLELKLDRLYNGVTRVVNGLVCCADIQPHLPDGVKLTLHNVFTGEKMKVPDPETIPGRYKGTASTYHLGYSPMTGDYKIMRLVFHLDHDNDMVVNLPLQAETIVLRPAGSDSSWRRIKFNDSGLAGLRLRSKSVYKMISSNEVGTFPEEGVVCWFRPEEGLILFNFDSEKFWRVKLPEELLMTAKFWSYAKLKRVFAIPGFNGFRSVALYVLPEDEKPECFVLDDYEKDTWRKEDVEFPEDMKGGYAVADGDSMLLLMGNQENNSRLVYGLGDDRSMQRFRVGKLRNRAKPLVWTGRGPSINHSLISTFDARLSCLHDSSVLYRSIDDVLTANPRQ